MTPYELRLERDSRERWQRALDEAQKEQPQHAPRVLIVDPVQRRALPHQKRPADWIASLPNTRTVSSRTIAGLTGKRHTVVLRDIRRLVARLSESLGVCEAMDGICEVRDRRGFAVECRLSQTLALALLAGYDPIAVCGANARLEGVEDDAPERVGPVAQPTPDLKAGGSAMARQATPRKPARSSMTSLEIADTSIRTDAEGRFCLNDLHRASGGEQRHRPKYWLENSQTQALVAEMSIGGIPPIEAKQGLGTYVARELVYAYAMWISPAFHSRVIRALGSEKQVGQCCEIGADRAGSASSEAQVSTGLAWWDGRGVRQELSMTSLEIAELTGKGHFNVMRDIRKMFDDLANSNLNWPTQTTVYEDSQGKSRPMYTLNKNLTLTLLAGYSTKARYRVICRWQELEERARQGVTPAPETAGTLRGLQSRIAALEANAAERAAIRREYASISAMRHKYGYPFSWEELKKASLQHGLRIRQMPSGKCSYHRLAWLEAYGIEL